MIRICNTGQDYSQEYTKVSSDVFLRSCTASPANKAVMDCFQLCQFLIHAVSDLSITKNPVSFIPLCRKVWKPNMMRLGYYCRENGTMPVIQPKSGAGIHMIDWQNFSRHFTRKHLLIFQIQLSKVMIFCSFFYYLLQKLSVTPCILSCFHCILFCQRTYAAYMIRVSLGLYSLFWAMRKVSHNRIKSTAEATFGSSSSGKAFMSL